MTSWIRFGALAIIGLSQASMTAAAPATSARIIVEGVSIDVPFPAGFCQSTDPKVIAGEQLLASADKDNFTHLTLTECGKSADYKGKAEYILIKSPKRTMPPQTRSELLAAFAKMMPEITRAVKSPEIATRVSSNLEDSFGTSSSIAPTISPSGIDDTCLYLTGSAQSRFENLGISYVTGMAGCFSTVNRQFVAVNWYNYDPSPPAIEQLKRKSKALLMAMSKGPQ